MARYIPFPFYHDDMPVDISSAFGRTAPAGRHGFLQVQGDRLVFEDGTPGLFWGVNFNGGACFPPFDYSEKVAARLRKSGVNLVRFHQLDAEWNTPNIFSFQKGQRVGHTQSLHPESMKRLDYLVSCLKKEGVYCYLDMNTYRNFKSGDGVENAAALKDAADPYCYYNRRLIDLQKKFMYDIWNHVNQFTGLAYKDDPVFVLTEIINERDFFGRERLRVEPYVQEFRGLYEEWLRERQLPGEAWAIDINDDGIDSLVQFKVEVQRRFYREMYDYMREIGVRIPIAGTNWYINGAVTRSNQAVNDFMDSHTYYYDWNWGEHDKRCMNRAITQSPSFGMESISSVRALDRPLFVSEWDMPWPNEYRAESPVLYAAIGALQGWSGWAIHTYAYGTRLRDMNILGKEVSSSTIGGVPYREGIFSTWNDPAKYGLFYHAALIARRQDVAIAPETLAVRVEDLISRQEHEALSRAAEWKRVGVTFAESDPVAQKTVPQSSTVLEDTGEVISVTGELYRSWQKNYGSIDTERTKCVYGFLGKQGEIQLQGLTVAATTDFCVLALSSLTDAGIRRSDNLLLTAVGRARNTEARFDGDQMLSYGRPPVLVEVIEASISIEVDNPNMKVWSVNAEGMFAGSLPSEYHDGRLTFKIGDTMASMYYLIQAE
ncbi:MAG: hypothetical protein QM270_11335 [Bacillota bacterium]|nr:hypothetical protein [Bacillota bacterium]